MKLKPLGDRLIVRAIEEEETTASGIVLPDTAKEKPQKGKVLAVGEGRYDEDAHRWIRDWVPLKLPYLQLWVNSLVLLLSSVTLECARRNLNQKEEFAAMGIVPPRTKHDMPWLGMTLLLGLGFLAG